MRLDVCEIHRNISAMGVRSKLAWPIVALCLLLCLATAPLHAKVAAGVSGIVTDPKGAVVPGATIKANATETGIVETQQTNAEGFYSFLDLPPGHYDIEVSHPGFSEFKQTGIQLDLDSAKVLNVKLTVGQVNEQVQVSSSAVQLDTGSTQMGQVISAETMTSVPLVTRSYTDLLALQPGVSPVSSGLAGGQGGQFSATGFTFTPVSGDLNAGNLSVNGQREADNGFLLNGTTVQEFAFSGTAIIPNLDSISEFRILTNNFDAEYGNYSGGQINVVTKAGGNQFHGSTFEFLRNTDLDARNFFATERDDYKQNQFGGTIGGPIKHDSVFFFGDYQGNRVIIGQSALGKIAVPTDAERTGDFSAPSLAAALTGTVQGPYWAQQLSSNVGYTVSQHEPYYFAGCNSSQCVFPGAQIPASLFTAPSKNMLKYVPPVSATDGSGNAFFIPPSSPERLQDDKTSGRIDYNARIGLVSGYYFFDQYNQTVPNALLPGFGSDYYGRSQVVSLGDAKTLNNNALNEARRSGGHAGISGFRGRTKYSRNFTRQRLRTCSQRELQQLWVRRLGRAPGGDGEHLAGDR
jgi:hypothetical protein